MRTGHEVQTHILLKVEEDPEFREHLVRDPKGVIEAETGLVLPEDELVFVHSAIEAAVQGTPFEPPLDDEVPLTEEELTQVTGGSCTTQWDGTVVCDTSNRSAS